MQEEQLTPAEAELEAALRSLRPARAAIDRDRLMFRAGRASARRGGRIWLGTAVILGAALGLSLAFRPGPQEVVRVVEVQREPDPARPPAAPPLTHALARSVDWSGRGQYLRLRREVLAKGLDALPEPETTAAPELPENLERLLGTPRPKGVGRLWGGFGLLIRGDRS